MRSPRLHRLCDTLRALGTELDQHVHTRKGQKCCIHTWELLGWRIRRRLHGFRLKLMYVTQHLFDAKNSRSTILAVCPHFLWHNSEQFLRQWPTLYLLCRCNPTPISYIHTHTRTIKQFKVTDLLVCQASGGGGGELISK